LASYLDAEARGTTGYAAIRPKQFLSMKIPLPPLPEQKRIVAKVQSLTSKLDEAREIREQSLTHTAALCAAAEMRLWPDTCLTDAPTLDEVTTVLSRGRQSEQGESEHYLIKTQHVQMGRYRKTDLRLSDRAASRVSDDLLVQRGDILIACSAAGCLGRVAWCDETRTASCDTHVAIARPHPARVLPEYLYAYLRGAQGQYQLRSREKGDWQREKIGFRLTELNVNDMRRVPVFVPDTETQRQLVSASAALQRRIDDLNSRATDTERMLDALPPSILDSAFKGEL
jgi:type I restriction enzyme S subunit